MNIFKKNLGVNEVKERLAKFEEQIGNAEEERAGLQEQLTAALATGYFRTPAAGG